MKRQKPHEIQKDRQFGPDYTTKREQRKNNYQIFVASKPVFLTPMPPSLTPSILWAEANLGIVPLGTWKSRLPASHKALNGPFSPETAKLKM